ncbi:MAG TPA: FmdE family protein [Deltaproteobacteria bacterium]|mgnify:CR=1 FL=1|nr:FmdE family protein [Deltaproteobacteria bacterium]
MGCAFPAQLIENTISFHGHACPGLMIGIRAAELALRELGAHDKPNLVAVVETDMCGVDAIQFLTGCTFGKGNLIHKDYGKMAFSFFHRPSNRGFRALLNPSLKIGPSEELRALISRISQAAATPEEQREIQVLRQRSQEAYLAADLDELFIRQPNTCPAPRPARILESLACEDCGEKTMESRTRRFGGRTLCIPCFLKIEQKI